MIYDVTQFPPSVTGSYKLYLNGSEITNICPRFDPDEGWADVFIFDQNFKYIPDARNPNEVIPMFARMFGNITVTGVSDFSVLDAERYRNGERREGVSFSTEPAGID